MSKSDISKFLSLVLRHKPETIDIVLDKNGWVETNMLIEKINKKTFRKIDMLTLERIVESDDKKRFAFNSDKSKIRASQGHSLNIDLELKEIKPPDTLYHGTATRFLDSIMKSGINKQKRTHVHLSKNCDTAYKVGSRYGKVVILKIDAKKMNDKGYKFYCSENKVWLTERVPVEFIEIVTKF